MAWTEPAPLPPGSLVDAAVLNTYVRDNLNALADAKQVNGSVRSGTVALSTSWATLASQTLTLSGSQEYLVLGMVQSVYPGTATITGFEFDIYDGAKSWSNAFTVTRADTTAYQQGGGVVAVLSGLSGSKTISLRCRRWVYGGATTGTAYGATVAVLPRTLVA